MSQVFLSTDNEYKTQYVIYHTKFVQKLAFTYRNCPLSLETIKHCLARIDSLLWSSMKIFLNVLLMT